MLGRNQKALYFAAATPLMTVNGFLYRHFKAPRDGFSKVHLGPGQGNYLDSWLNVDANTFTAKCDVWADLKNPLPFHDFSIQYSGQFLGVGLEKSYPPHRVQVQVKHGARMDSLNSIVAGLLTTAGHLANRNASFC